MPSISFAQSASATQGTGVGSVAVTLPSPTTAGSLLVAHFSTFDSPTVTTGARVVVTDTLGNTWSMFGDTPSDTTGLYSRGFFCLSGLGGSVTVTATYTDPNELQNTLGVAEFLKPSTLVPFSADGRGYPSVTPLVAVAGPRQLPGPGLLFAGFCNNRSDFAMNTPTTFIALPDQAATGNDLRWGYAINPEGSVQCSWSRPAGSGRGCTQLMAFLDTAGFAARPRPVGGRGASW